MLLSCSVHDYSWIIHGVHELAKLIEDFMPQVLLDDHSAYSNFHAPQKGPSFLKKFGTTIVSLNLHMWLFLLLLHCI